MFTFSASRLKSQPCKIVTMQISSEQRTQTLLFFNLSILVKLHGAPRSLKECVKEGMFSRPNRTAFEEVLHFLVDAYDSQLSRSAFTIWPIIERKTQERVFRREVEAAVGKIASQEPDFELPVFSRSFMSTPGGVRLERFLCRLSSLVLHRVLERRGELDLYGCPKGSTERFLSVSRARTSAQAGALCKEIRSFLSLTTRCAEETRRLNEKLIETSAALKAEHFSLSELKGSDKAEIFDAETEKNIRGRLEKLQNAQIVIGGQKKRVQQCGNAARVILDDRLVPAVLDGGCDEPLDVADLLKRVLNVVGTLSSSLFSTDQGVALPELHNMTEDITATSQLLGKALNGMTQLMSSETYSGAATHPEPVGMGTPIINERFQGACQLLAEASYRTPPLELRPRSNGAFVSLFSDTESPPMNNVTDLLCTKKPIEGGRRGVQKLISKNVINKSTPTRSPSGIGRSAIHNLTSARAIHSSLSSIPKPKPAVASRAPHSVPGSAPKQINSKGPTLIPSHRKAPTGIPNSTPKSVKCNVRDSKKEISPNAIAASVAVQHVPDDPVQNVLDLAVSLLSPVSSVNEEEQIFPEIDRESSATNLEPFKFSENFSDSLDKKEEPAEPEKNGTSRKTEARKSILDVVNEYKMITANFAPTEASPSENGDDYDITDINLDEEYDSFIKPIELSLEWEKNDM